jgi:ABC-2 type transport system permease protein/lipopolysaccharide transport system permease protein
MATGDRVSRWVNRSTRQQGQAILNWADIQPTATTIAAATDRQLAGAVARVWESDSDLTLALVRDFSEALRRRSLWTRLAWQDVLLRYRRSWLGPFWLTLSMGVMIASLGVVYGDIFKVDMHDYLPYITVGLLVWGLISTCIAEGCQTFIEAEWFIKQIDLPISMFPFRVVSRNTIIFAHNCVIYVLVMAFFGIGFTWTALLAIPGLLIVILNGICSSLLLGMLSARFRDLPQIIASVLQIAFFATPVFWRPDLVSNNLVVMLNPFYHFIELVRAPLLGAPPPLSSCVIAGAITIGGVALSLVFSRRFRSRVAFWV